MKKTKLISALLAFLPFLSAFAQEGDIIYRDFEPDSILIYWHKLGPVWIDLDADGVANDLCMQMVVWGDICYPKLMTTSPNVRVCTITSDNLDIVLSEVEEEDWKHYVGWTHGNTAAYYSHYGFRIQHEDGYYYGWFETYNRVVSQKNEKQIAHYGFDRTAYCTIPNYPLHWGQTGITGVEENESTAFATVHPNPTTGMVSITGENLRKAEVTNMLGQHVATASGQGGQLTADISRLPAGVYFVSVTDESGKKCVRKVVKE